MQCPNCKRDWPDEFKVCPICVVPLSASADQVGGDKMTTGDIGDESAVAIGQDSIAVAATVNTMNIYHGYPTDQPLPLPEALKRYLDNLIDTHQHLRLQGIRAGGQPVSVDLEKVYISLSIVEKHRPLTSSSLLPTSSFLTIAAALARYRRLVIIGDPGSGKTTLLAYLALTYARDLRDRAGTVQARLQLAERDCLPVLLPLRDLARHLREKCPDPGHDGPALLLDYLHNCYAAQCIPLPAHFFEKALAHNRAVVLLDGMDEVADLPTRQRIARLIEKFAVRYGGNRFVVTSREVGYEGPARIAADFGLAKVRDFNRDEVRCFVRDWTRVVEIKLAGRESPDILRLADEQAGHLIQAIEANPRIAELAVNPLLLTVIALVHRYRAALPERRSELYEEAVEVLLARWDEAKGLETETNLAGRALDAGDRRMLLEPVALWLHEQQRREIELGELRTLLLPPFKTIAEGRASQAAKAVDAFVKLINERSGLLIERGVGVYGFAHLTFQEYLASRAVAGRDDALAYTLARLPDPWWREVILLEVGYISGQSKQRVSDLIQAIMDADPSTEPQPYHHLILAAECLYDVGAARTVGDLLGQAKRRLQAELDRPLEAIRGQRELALRRVAAANALSQIESGRFGAAVARYWKPPWGEPDWVEIPAGEFWMGSQEGRDDEKPVHRLYLPAYAIARVPVTNAQYALYVADQAVKPPSHWSGGQPPKGQENHPVVNVSWRGAMAYCRWLSRKTGKAITLPSEAEWEKAARGGVASLYPWGDAFDPMRCNTKELGLGGTSPVGFFLSGASPYGCLDMVGNVWEWTLSLWGVWTGKEAKLQFGYPYDPADGRETLEDRDDMLRVLRGGSFYDDASVARCAQRDGRNPNYGNGNRGFRLVVSPTLPSL